MYLSLELSNQCTCNNYQLVDVTSKPFSKTLSLLMALQYYLLLVCLLLLNNISAGFPSPKFSLPLHRRKTLKIVILTILCWGV